MKRYLSFGGGVNSTALMLLLLDDGVEFEAVYADHGADWPETRDYVRILVERGYPVTVLDTGDLHAVCVKRGIMPTRWLRWCTADFKVKPLRHYLHRPAVVYMGISSDEAHRAKPSGDETLEHEYPLVDRNIDRKGCVDIIKAHSLEVPMKSGCWFCPFQRASQWRELRTRHPELFCNARALENMVNDRLRVKHGSYYKPMYLSNTEKPLDVVAQDGQLDLWGERSVEPCLCEL